MIKRAALMLLLSIGSAQADPLPTYTGRAEGAYPGERLHRLSFGRGST